MDEPQVNFKRHVSRYDFSAVAEVKLSLPLKNHRDFLSVLDSRKTIRKFCEIDIQSIGKLFYFANRTIQIEDSDLGLSIEHRPVISSGALHSVEIMFWLPQYKKWFHYNSQEHKAEEVVLKHQLIADMVDRAYSFMSGSAGAALIWYVSDIQRLGAKYDNPESLAYRDSGAILATHSLVSEYLNLSFCPLGLAGKREAYLISNDRDFVGVGMSLVGERER